jgi:ABC-type phosphate transport system permease subunit
MEAAGLILEEDRGISEDLRAELWLGALVCGVVVVLAALIVFTFVQAWPSFAHNGLHWFGPGGSPDNQLTNIFNSSYYHRRSVYEFHAWPLIWSTILTTVGSVVISFVCSLFIAVFIVEFAPAWLKRMLEPVIRLLASVPPVVYGLVTVVVLIPYIGNHLISEASKASVTPVISLTGASLLAAVLVLSIMIAPIMIAIFVESLKSVPRNWIEGSLALGVNPWRTFWKVAVRTIRPALIAGTVLATARAVGETVTLAMVSGGVGFAPNPADGLIFFFEPSRGLPATILLNGDGMAEPAMKHTLFAIAAVLLFSSMMLSLAGWAAKQPMKRYFTTGGASG